MEAETRARMRPVRTAFALVMLEESAVSLVICIQSRTSSDAKADETAGCMVSKTAMSSAERYDGSFRKQRMSSDIRPPVHGRACRLADGSVNDVEWRRLVGCEISRQWGT